MKKFLGILAIAATLVACDNSASSEQRTKDSTDSVRRVDSINAAMPAAPATITPSTDSGAGTTGADTSGASKMSADTTK
ncbi:MAG: hypothetical protein JWR72_400 [Flavisolibacter sp.]|jgi:hypothetical protein|nr:hypothetical protein [Flavisolibacter sp.]